jgi:hypothetical protein
MNFREEGRLAEGRQMNFPLLGFAEVRNNKQRQATAEISHMTDAPSPPEPVRYPRHA